LKQKQDIWVDDVLFWRKILKASHKAGTALWRVKEDGLTVCKVAKKIKSEFGRVGLSASAIHCHVIILGRLRE
jgi:hypothetical protein